MPEVTIVDEKTLIIAVTVKDAITMIHEAARHVDYYAYDIITIFEKMPEFHYKHFCFYAYDSARLFEKMLGIDPKYYLSFSLDAPDEFFYTLYGGMAGLFSQAKKYIS